MSTTLTPSTPSRKMVPIELLRDLARIAITVSAALQVYLKDKSGRTRSEMIDHQKRLSREARAAITLYNTTPEMFTGDSPATAPDLEPADVAAWLERHAGYLNTHDPANLPDEATIERNQFAAAALIAAAEVLDVGEADFEFENGGEA